MTPGCTCEFCGKPIAPTALGTHRYASGWTEYRGSTGGAHGLKDAVLHDKFMHPHCFAAQARGVSSGQASFEDAA